MSEPVRVTRAWGPTIVAEALVMREGFSPRYDLNRVTGIISRIGHSVEGQSVKGRILVIPTTKGGVAGGWAFADMLEKGISPAGLVFGKLNPVMVQGAVLANIPITEGWTPDLLEMVQTGDRLRIDPARKTIEVLGK